MRTIGDMRSNEDDEDAAEQMAAHAADESGLRTADDFRRSRADPVVRGCSTDKLSKPIPVDKRRPFQR